MPESYSVNQLKTWEKCRKKYELDYVRQLHWPSNPKNFRLGRSVHQLLDYEARGLSVDPLVTTTDEDIRQAWQALSHSSWAELPIVASEWGFSLAIKGRWLYGRIDRIAQQQDTLAILDWKTGTSIPRSPETDWQTLVYLYAVSEAQREFGLSLPYEQMQFTYVQVRQGVIQDITIPYSQSLHQETRQRLLTTMEAIEAANNYPLPNKCPDKFCPYFHTCGINAPMVVQE